MKKPRVEDPLLLAGIGDLVYFNSGTQSIVIGWLKVLMSNTT